MNSIFEKGKIAVLRKLADNKKNIEYIRNSCLRLHIL